MNDRFDKLTKGLAQAVTRTLLCLAVAVQFAWPARANDFRRGPLIDLSDPDALAACGSSASDGTENEPYVVVNPTNPKNIVATWTAGFHEAIGAAVTLDGGKTWQQGIVPGLTVCDGTPYQASDPWLSFAHNGDLYLISGISSTDYAHNRIVVSKSGDGGMHWSSHTTLEDDPSSAISAIDKPSITADPADARFVYATWEFDSDRGVTIFSRSTDGGQTWEPARQIYDPGENNLVTDHTMIVLPDGTLVNFFTEFCFNYESFSYDTTLSSLRSVDHGQTWSSLTRGPSIPAVAVTDPDTGYGVASLGSFTQFFSVAVDRRNGNLYAVWEDTQFSGGQFTSVAFAMSRDGGFTWSTPIPINQTPRRIAPGNRQAFLPSVAVTDDGTIGVSYYDFRFNDVRPGLATDVWLVQCHPTRRAPATNPASWGDELRLTNKSFDMETATTEDRDAYFVGDYEGLTAVGRDFLAVWCQPHGTDPDSIFFRRVHNDEEK